MVLTTKPSLALPFDPAELSEAEQKERQKRIAQLADKDAFHCLLGELVEDGKKKLVDLYKACREGNEEEILDKARVWSSHTQNLQTLANLPATYKKQFVEEGVDYYGFE